MSGVARRDLDHSEWLDPEAEQAGNNSGLIRCLNGRRQLRGFLDGLSKVGGLFGSKSFASSHPYPPEIYLEDAWLVNADDGLDRMRTDTAGVLITGSEISTIEFFKPKWSNENERTQAIERGIQSFGPEGLSTIDPDEQAQPRRRIPANDQRGEAN